jgi:glycine C-acetyltransferase/8-amino-7-oxononanoate synthase
MNDFDVVIVGARCAGASTAIHLSKRGLRVACIDKASFPSDTISTHFVWSRGASYINRLGLLEKLLETTPRIDAVNLVIDGVSLTGSVDLKLLSDRFETVHGESSGMTSTNFSARRFILDQLLLEEAKRCGVTVLDNALVDDLVWDGARVIGVTCRSRKGTDLRFTSSLVIGADGRGSKVASLVDSKVTESRSRSTFAAYTYFSGLQIDMATLQRKGRLGAGIAPTNNGQFMVLAFGPHAFYEEFKKDRDNNYRKTISLVSPSLRDIVESGTQCEKLYVSSDQSAFMRKTSGPGWALVGDAACFKDQLTASGITHAFRDAELLAQTVGTALADGDPVRINAAAATYSDRRHTDSWDYFDFVGAQAEMHPTTAHELQFAQAAASDRQLANDFISAFSDAAPVREFFSNSNIHKVLQAGDKAIAPRAEELQSSAHQWRNPYADRSARQDGDDSYLHGTLADFAQPVGSNILDRTEKFSNWVAQRETAETWIFSRTLKSPPSPTAEIVDNCGRTISGINFASQDYLSLGRSPEVIEAAIAAVREFGPHSAGSAMVIGNTASSLRLEEKLSRFLRKEHVVLFPTGWAAGFGSIFGLIGRQDHLVMDKYAHACLQRGAYAATENVYRCQHLDNAAIRSRLQAIRARDTVNGIMVVTEGIFSMDSDTPRLRELQAICREYQATLLVDVAHDLGSMGPGGTGELGAQGCLDDVDLVMGSFSKTFASNGGFLASNSSSVKQFVKAYSNSHMFSNALSPFQTGTVSAALDIIASSQGDALRCRLMDNIEMLRSELSAHGCRCLGKGSPIVPVHIGEEAVARHTHRNLQRAGLAAMVVEFPAVSTGAARVRLQVMADHRPDEVMTAARIVADAISQARNELSLA